MQKKDKIFYIVIAVIALLDLMIPVLIFNWEEWAPELLSLKRIGLHLLSLFGAAGVGAFSAYYVKSLIAKAGMMKVGVLAIGGAAVSVGYVKVIQQDGSISKVAYSNVQAVRDTGKLIIPVQAEDWILATQSNSAGVYVGAEYKTKIMMFQPSMLDEFVYYVNGKEVGKDKNGIPYYSEIIRGANYDDRGMFRKKISITAKSKNPKNPKVFQYEDVYEVSKPYLLIQSASVQALYKNCGNDLSVQVPALGATYNPVFTADGATCIPGDQKGMVTIVPSDSKVILHVASGGISIGSQEFKVRLIPKPIIECLNGNSRVNEVKGIPAPGPRTLMMKAIPDESFAAFLPKDARYLVAEWDCILVRGKRPVATNNFKNEVGDLANFTAVAQPGDRILIEVKKVLRTNYLGKEEVVNLGAIIKNIPLI